MSVKRETILPWQHSQWELLIRQKSQNRFPHALLFIGEKGAGKQQFVEVFSQYLLCQSPEKNHPCDVCRACVLVRASSHPDQLWIKPEEKQQAIKVDAIRDMIKTVNETVLLGKHRVVIIHPANAMNAPAANALLKTLEEPASNTVLLLTSDNIQLLPLTIVSRCQRVIFNKPIEKSVVALEYRQEVYQDLLHLAEKKASPLQVAARWQEKEIKLILDLVFSWIRDLMRIKLAHAEVINTDYRDDMMRLAARFSSGHLLMLLDEIQKNYARMIYAPNLNRQLLLEEMLIRWIE